MSTLLTGVVGTMHNKVLLLFACLLLALVTAMGHWPWLDTYAYEMVVFFWFSVCKLRGCEVADCDFVPLLRFCTNCYRAYFSSHEGADAYLGC